MSSKPRVVLGPVARQLVGDAKEGVPKVLDDAITTLMEERDQRPDAASPEGRLASLEATLKEQSEALRQLSYVSALEMKMTRVLIASLMSKTDEDQQSLISLANSAVQEVHEKARLIADSDMEKLRENEISALTAIQRELERAGLEEQEKSEAEIER
ncbi:hypothetical protein [Epibacterium sp. Ofav1-8]|uniref:hypothetical protein n=1 Tax=Epibacterium sp. Ofav1-8 TaxID=2917735 RepID=UPI001EF48678|nr:hypothetical protein [Epibacterium sp. Ofav1-8]MCG7625931.1 hypothetical protein [Epibacterium sp. Ofav1-8]